MLTKYYQKNKKRLRKESLERYQNLSVKEKNKERRKACERCQNFSEEEKEKSVNTSVNYTEIFQKNKNKS